MCVTGITLCCSKKEEACGCPPQIQRVCADIQAYTEGEKVDFSYVILCDDMLTAFQKKVYHFERTIPYGYVISYSTLAKKVGGSPGARAIGVTQAKNPFPIIVPCHKVVQNDGALGGFQYGEPFKAQLLRIEGVPVHEKNKKLYVDKAYMIQGK